MRHRVLTSRQLSRARLETLMKRTHVPTGIIDYPVDQVQNGDFAFHSAQSDLTDEVSMRPVRGTWPSHPCDHVKSSATLPEGRIVYANGASGSYTYDLTFQGNLPGFATILYGLSPSTVEDLAAFVASLQVQGAAPAEPFIDWEALENDFLEISNNILKKEVLIGETVAQPQLVIDAVRFLISPARGMQRFVKYAVKRYSRRELRSSTGKVVRRALLDAANSTLLYNFAVKPLISDIQGISRSSDVIKNQLDYLRRRKGQYVPVRVRQVAATDAFPLAKADGSAPDPLPTSSYHPVYSAMFTSPPEILLVAGMGAKFRIRQDLTLEANFNAYAQYFGIGQVVGLLWELVPFSFVIDWVTNVQERIQKFSQVHTYNPFCDSKDFCATLKRVEHKPVRVSSGVLPAWSASIREEDSGTEISSVSTTRFTRFLTIPESRSLFDWSNIGLSQIINGGSLLIQKLLKTR